MAPDPLTAADEIAAIREALCDAGFDVQGVYGQLLIYRAPTGDRFKIFVSKLRGT